MIHTATLFAVRALLQGAAGPATAPPRPPATGTAATTAVAVRTSIPVVVDGRDDDPIWRSAPPIADFTEFVPVEGAPARYRTEAKVAFDDHNFYVFIRAYDPEPRTISTVLARRDVRPPTDQLKIMIDAYHDRRTGYEFAVSPGGVKRDYAVYDDNNEDESWDGVWDVATRVDSLGWTAEFRVPLSQLRFAPAKTHTFGFAIWRDIERYKERVAWPAYRPTQIGFMSQLGDVTGIDDIPAPRRLDVSPYAVAKNAPLQTATGFDRHQSFSAGADFKYGVTSNYTLDGTVNPDFGQVEADPAVLNLTAFETFFQEKRPFFLEGTGVYKFGVNCNQVNCQGEGLFYSRRIGRAPQLGNVYGDATSPTATTILGAAKLTGRSASGLTVGLLEAVTARETGPVDRTIEPASNYAVLRLQQDLNNHRTGVGAIFTAVDRALDSWTRPGLRSGAYVGGVDFRHRFGPGHNYELTGAVTASDVTGSRAAIAATQADPTHYYQRPDAPLGLDTTRTGLAGDAETIHFAKYGGGLVYFETSYQRIAPGFEINDLGFLNRADWQDQSTWVGLNWQKPTSLYQSFRWNFNEWHDWTAAGGLLLEQALNTNAHLLLHNQWMVMGGGTLGQLGATYCDRCARGGPALRQNPYVNVWGEVVGDQRAFIFPDVWWQFTSGDEGRTHSAFIGTSTQLRLSARTTTSLGTRYSRNRDNTQWYGNFTDSAAVLHYTFAHLEQQTLGLTVRFDYTASPTLTLQVYANPFVSKGTFSNVREIANARAADYASRFAAYGDTAVTGNPGGFNFKQFNSNTVLRWEYKPGSEIFLVWTQGRQDVDGVAGTRSFTGDVRDLFHTHPLNTFLIKVSHWFDW